MFQAGELIMYGNEGVCRVESVGPLPMAGADPSRPYYTLTAIFRHETIYAPVEGRVPMRPVMDRAQAECLLAALPAMGEPEDVTHDIKAAQAEYRSALNTQDAATLLTLIRRIYHKNEDSRKPYSQLDDKYFRLARDVLYGELSVALDIPLEAVEETLRAAAEK